LGIKGPVKLDGDSDEGATSGKQELDQGGAAGALDNPEINKCSRRQNFMNKKHDLLTEAIQQYKEETELADDPEEILSVPEYITQNKMRDAVAHANFLSKKNIVLLKNEMNEKSEFIFKLKGRNYELWKPERLRMNSTMKEVLEKTE
jgi:hypothetical protein